VPVAGDTARAIAILGIRLWAAAVARANQRRLELALDHRLNELTHPLTQPGFDGIEPIVEKMDRRRGFRLQGRRRRAIVGHGAVSTGVFQSWFVWVSAPGDYSIIYSIQTPVDTSVLAYVRND